jgi:hypothetical protein
MERSAANRYPNLIGGSAGFSGPFWIASVTGLAVQLSELTEINDQKHVGKSKCRISLPHQNGKQNMW